MHRLLLFPLFWILGFSTAENPITGPKMVRGVERGNLTVQCQYASTWKTYKKYWCQGAFWSSCQIVVDTNKAENEVKKGRVSIRDDQEKFMFTVTMEDLRRDDSGTYWCAIERTGADHGIKIKVTIDLAPATVPATVPTTSASTTNAFTAPAVVEETNVLPTLTSHHSNGRRGIAELSIVLPIVFAVLLLLLVVASLVAWRMVRRQKKGGEMGAARAAGPSPEQVLQPLEGDLCYANLSLQQPGTSPGSIKPSSSAQANQVEVDYVTMAPFPRKDISYASLSLDTVDQEPTYSNVNHVPSLGHDVPTEYSTIRRL